MNHNLGSDEPATIGWPSGQDGPLRLPGTGEPAPPAHVERQLLDSIERILRAPAGRLVGWMLLVLHLSRLPPPGPQPHHRRVAAAVLDDAAARSNGQLFALANGDMVLLFRPGDDGLGFMAVVARLFPLEAGRTLWRLPEDGAPALDYLRTRCADGTRAVQAVEPPPGIGVMTAMDAVLHDTALPDLMHRHTAVLLRPGKPVPMVPLYREVSLSTAVLAARMAALGQGGASAASDPFLFSHVAARLDQRMLGALQTDVPGGGLLSMGLGAAALHINITVSGVLSTGFATFAAAAKDAIAAGLCIGLEMSLVEAFADPKAFLLARERLRLAGLRLVLDGVAGDVLLLTALNVLAPALVKLNWSTAFKTAGEPLDRAIAALNPERIVLDQADTEAAMAWGLAHGIARFQGLYVDRMLAAERLRLCPQASHCSLRQCTERATATGASGRAGCRNTKLLDLAAPITMARATA